MESPIGLCDLGLTVTHMQEHAILSHLVSSQGDVRVLGVEEETGETPQKHPGQESDGAAGLTSGPPDIPPDSDTPLLVFDCTPHYRPSVFPFCLK